MYFVVFTLQPVHAYPLPYRIFLQCALSYMFMGDRLCLFPGAITVLDWTV
jgi:hypothetical protein